MKALERIPLHDHVDRNSGGQIGSAQVTASTGGITGTSGSTAFPLAEELLTAETDATLVLAPDGAGGVEFRAEAVTGGTFLTTRDGEGHAISTTPASGASLTIDVSLANIFDITLTANCTLSISNPPAAGVGGIITVILRQGGSGSYTVTWPGSVVWQDPSTGGTGGSAPTLFTAVGAQDDVELATLDGGVTWGGTHLTAPPSFATPAIVLGTAAAAGSAITVIRSDATIVAFDTTVPAEVSGTAGAVGVATVAARRDHVHDAPLHAHVVEETHLSDGSTTTWTLDEVYAPGSVIAWNTTTIARLSVTEVAPDKATVSAAGASGDKIVFDYAAVVA